MGRATDIPHRVYTAEFKGEAVKLADEVGITEAAKRLDMPTSSIRNWMRIQPIDATDWLMRIQPIDATDWLNLSAGVS
jgi:hypothetical protein